MIKFDMSKYKESFKAEASDLFGNIEELLLSVEKDESINSEQIQELFRAVHTLKGGGSSVGYTYFSKFVHEFETLLDKMRSGEILFEPAMSTLFIEYYDKSKELFTLEVDEKINKDVYQGVSQELIYQIRSLMEEKLQPDKQRQNATENFGFFDEKYKNVKTLFRKKEISVSEKQSLNFGFFDENESKQKNMNFGFFDKRFSDKNHTTDKAKEDISHTQVEPQEQKAATHKEKAPKEEVIRSRELNSSTIRVDLSKIDVLVNNIGELVIGMSMLSQFASSIADTKIKSGLFERIELIERHIRELQESVMSTRMVPMENIYSKFPKQIRDVSKKLNKEIDLKTYGDSVEIDKAMIEGLSDPLMHIIRNACDHGLETPQEREKKGKNRSGTIILGAEQANGQIIVTISDDGGGIDGDKVVKKALEKGIVTQEKIEQMTHQEKIEMIFEAGLSTAAAVTDISGRGVGMDVVKENISKLGGIVKIESKKDEGTKFIISLPLTLAILEGLNISVGKEIYILPLSSIVESLQPEAHMLRPSNNGKDEILVLRDEALPIIRLHEVFDIEPQYDALTKGMLIIVRLGTGKIALFVDMFLTQQQVVIKAIEKNFRQVEGIGGGTVRGDGSIGLIIDIAGIYNIYKRKRKAA